jgi:hypothetical protein
MLNQFVETALEDVEAKKERGELAKMKDQW